MKSRYLLLAGIMILLIANCTKPYTPKAITGVNNYLVVEGVINTGGNDSTIIKLSRTVPLTAGVGTTPEIGATVSIQSNNGQSYILNEIKPGLYLSDILNLSNINKYRLNITTADGEKYATDYVASIQTPAIDSVGFIIKNNGMQLYVNTHDPKNNTRYYRWDYTETWQFHSKYFSSSISNGVDSIIPRTRAQYIYDCWGNSISNDIILGSSAKLTQDVIYQNMLTFVGSTSEKIESRYSILVKQYGLTADGYSYFEQLRKNTEELGGIFDPQPSQLTGNVHCTSNPSTPAIGYITAGTIQQKRIFVNNEQVPSNWIVTYPYNCELDTALFYNPRTFRNDVLSLLIPPGSDLPTIPIYPSVGPFDIPLGYQYSSPSCVDCSLRGTLVKPSFWTP